MKTTDRIEFEEINSEIIRLHTEKEKIYKREIAHLRTEIIALNGELSRYKILLNDAMEKDKV